MRAHAVAQPLDREDGLDRVPRGTKYSDCSSLPLLGVNPMRKWGNRSYQGPGTPICSVQFSAESSTIGWRFSVARRAP